MSCFDTTTHTLEADSIADNAGYDGLSVSYDAMYAAASVNDQEPILANAIARLASTLGATRILDCSCGTGMPLLMMAHLHPHLQLTGTDASLGMLRQATRKANELKVQIGNLSAPHLPGGVKLGCCHWINLGDNYRESFGLAICLGHSIYHLVSREAIVIALRSMAACLSADGLLVVDMILFGDDFRSEVGPPNFQFRGALPAGHPKNPLEGDVLFLVTCHYEANPLAFRGIVQTKTLHVVETRSGMMSVHVPLPVVGAVFTPQDLSEMLEEAGLASVEGVQIEGSRYETLLARKGGST
jgi:SAM-dependent methyltransferase